MRFGEYLADGLTKAGHTQTSFAKKVGQKQSAVSAIVLGKRAPPLKHMSRWAEVLGKAVDRNVFLELARLEHCPSEIREQYVAMKAQLGRR